MPIAELGRSLLGTATDPLFRGTSQEVSRLAPIELPAPGALIDAWTRRYLTNQGVNYLLRLHGIRWFAGEHVGKGAPIYQQAWHTAYRGASERPSWPEVWDAFIRRRIDAKQLQKIGDRYNVALQDFVDIQDAYYDVPALGELLAMANRRDWDYATLAKHIQLRGMDQVWSQEMATLKDLIPSPSDLVRFGVREVFTPDTAIALGFDEEYPPGMEEWMKKQGLGYPVDITDPETGRTHTITWSRAEWWAHWQNIAPGQALRLYYLLRPNRQRVYDSPEMKGLDFGFNDLSLILKVDDYPKKWRLPLAALGRPQPGLRMLRLGIRTGVIDQAYVQEIFERQGHARFEASWQAEALVTDTEWTRRRAEMQAAGLSVRSAYHAGALSDQDYTAQLADLGFTPAEQSESLLLAKIEHQVQRIEESKRRIRQAVYDGSIDEPKAYAALLAAGIRADFAADWSADWRAEALLERKQIGARQIVKDACDYLLDIPTAIARLTNLRYDVSDVAVHVAEIQLCRAEAAQKQKERQDRLKEHQDAVHRRTTKGGAPPKLLKTWLQQQRISQDMVTEELTSRGWLQDEIDQWITDALSGT